jgi:capsular polysaccharide biosynthesis protein
MSAARSHETGGVTRFPEGEVVFQVFQVSDILRVFRRRFFVILLVMCLCAGLALGLSFLQTPVYQSSIKILVGQSQGFASDPAQATNLQLLTLTLGEAVDTYPVAQAVVQDLDLDISPKDMIANTNVEVITNTQFIDVSYTDTDPRRARWIANAIGDRFSDQVSDVSPKVSGITATVWEPAVVPQAPISPNPVLNILIGIVLGSMLGVALAFLFDYLDDRWQSPEEVERISGVSTIGVIPEIATSKGRKQ